jgi:hypothetical protein
MFMLLLDLVLSLSFAVAFQVGKTLIRMRANR